MYEKWSDIKGGFDQCILVEENITIIIEANHSQNLKETLTHFKDDKEQRKHDKIGET